MYGASSGAATSGNCSASPTYQNAHGNLLGPKQVGNDFGVCSFAGLMRCARSSLSGFAVWLGPCWVFLA
eukprot:2742758-Lingulodinium_polyedra.AAC.1